MSRVFRRVQYTDYLGELRAINDIYTENVFTLPQENLLFHYDFSDSSSMVLRSSGGTDYIETINDLAGNYNLTQSATTKQAIFTTDSFGNNCGVFDGVDDIFFFSAGALDFTLGRTAFAVFETDDLVPIPGDNKYYGGSVFDFLLIQNTTPTLFRRFNNQITWPVSAVTNSSENYLFVGIVPSQGLSLINDVTGSEQGGPAVTSTIISFGGLGELIGETLDPTSLKAKEYIYYNRNLTNDEVNSVVTYLKNKWNYNSW